jgi:hypothetical protein
MNWYPPEGTLIKDNGSYNSCNHLDSWVIEQCNFDSMREIWFYSWPNMEDLFSSPIDQTVAIFRVKPKP